MILSVEALYGESIRFTFDEQAVQRLLDAETYYPEEDKKRVKEILLQQRRKYGYLFR